MSLLGTNIMKKESELNRNSNANTLFIKYPKICNFLFKKGWLTHIDVFCVAGLVLEKIKL